MAELAADERFAFLEGTTFFLFPLELALPLADLLSTAPRFLDEAFTALAFPPP